MKISIENHPIILSTLCICGYVIQSVNNDLKWFLRSFGE
jgi:hypothetical protein